MNEKQEEISKIIVDYIRKHPDARDTLEGITRWWLHLEKIESSVDDVSIVLERLIKEGVIERQEINGDDPIYKICKKI
ncbi:MAG: hypothetical protein D8M57_19015 [Candidatus Scalindua sp. AMX11]|nr:hypothetical protein [Planctomycetota bacterium]RZV62001.1 MAG: hypothetical protein EX341_18660 [Candidatus Scalindua sp. SCAELEC01]TDE63309.1 MAG: hypothetical protein D8M57_19015 [Candidatus Scalindua sp. AMX11]GJQ57406.1 MAG: hypothetical protein SCALA701_02070 [Candidatus Scalindua sp.]